LREGKEKIFIFESGRVAGPKKGPVVMHPILHSRVHVKFHKWRLGPRDDEMIVDKGRSSEVQHLGRD